MGIVRDIGQTFNIGTIFFYLYIVISFTILFSSLELPVQVVPLLIYYTRASIYVYLIIDYFPQLSLSTHKVKENDISRITYLLFCIFSASQVFIFTFETITEPALYILQTLVAVFIALYIVRIKINIFLNT